MIKPRSFLSFLCLIFLISSCDESQNGRTLPRHSGEPGEILIVMDEDRWLGPEGDTLRGLLEAYFPQLPQAEPSFSLLQFSQGEMSNLLQQHRNILEVNIGPRAGGENKITLVEDKWSNDQLVFTAYAENMQEWYELVRTEMPVLVDRINDKEVQRLQKIYSRNGNDDLEELAKEKFGIDLVIPGNTEIAVNEEDFLWIKRERVKYLGNDAHDITQGFFIYRYPYTSDTAFSQTAILNKRDEFLKEYVPGPKKDTYMTTEYRYPPESIEITSNNRYTVLTRGLWKTENYFMGGPFMSLTTTTREGDQLISISGFVFAPKFDKREFVREIEAVLKSVRFPDAEA